MTQIQPAPTYREMLLEANAAARTNAQTPVNYFSVLTVKTGAVAGLIGAIIVMNVIAILTVSMTMDLWLAPRFISSVFLGEAAWAGMLPVIPGTIIHLILGTLYGAGFAFITPRIPRAFWFVPGIIYSMILWAIAAYTLPLLSQSSMMNDTLFTNALILSHIIFGIVLGIAGSFFGKNESE